LPSIKPLAEVAISRVKTNQSTIWQKSPLIKAQAEVAIFRNKIHPSISLAEVAFNQTTG